MDGPGRVDGNDRADRLGESPQILGTVPKGLATVPRFPTPFAYIPRFELGGTIPLIRK